MGRRTFFAMLLVVLLASLFAAKPAIRLTYSNYSLGTWTTFALPEKNSFLNVAKADLYFSGYGLTWYVGIPLQYSLEYYPALGVFDYPGPRPREIKWSLYVVDASTWVGRDFGAFSPRLGFDIPTGYPDDPNIAWIGSGSVRVSPGLGYSIAEEYHQDFYLKSPAQYAAYRSGSGRDQFLATTWAGQTWVADSVKLSVFSKPADSILKTTLSTLQYEVTQQSGTEEPFNNPYWNNHTAGIYLDIVSGEPLFSSNDKFESGTGWPSFTKPMVPGNIATRGDSSLGMIRTEVRSRYADSHLGHLFNDGPAPTYLRYCMNSAALLFIAQDDMQKEEYGQYLMY